MNVSPRCRYRWLVLVTLALMLVGCASLTLHDGKPAQPQLWQIAREVPGADPRWQRADTSAGVRVWRGGREIAARPRMELLPGDEIETGADVAVVLRFRDAGDVVVIEQSRVRIGSLEVIFGRMFALLRNRFTVTSETVVAGVEGTRFLFEVDRDRAVRVVVADGAVVCHSPQHAWPPIRLRTNEALLSRYPSRTPPIHTAADASEVRAYEQLARDISRAPEAGWCCRDGQVTASWSDRCAGTFDTERADALRQCRPQPPPAEPVGWCCRDGQVTRSTRSQCSGQFFDSEARAAACYRPPPVPPQKTPGRDPAKRQ